tara:strand:+ start:216 stop:725 length:510 start_codon:yes stop_codon:yes gene_type:complete
MKYVILLLLCLVPYVVLGADTNTTVSGTVVTDKSVPTASAPSVVVNNSDVCKSAYSAGVQSSVLGLSSGVTISDENCERIKLSRSLYGMGMKVAAISTLCQDYRVFDAMMMAGTPCPYEGQIGDDAKKSWLEHTDQIPEKSKYYKVKKKIKKTIVKTTDKKPVLNGRGM